MYRTGIAGSSIGDALRLEPNRRELSTGENGYDDLKLSVMCIE